MKSLIASAVIFTAIVSVSAQQPSPLGGPDSTLDKPATHPQHPGTEPAEPNDSIPNPFDAPRKTGMSSPMMADMGEMEMGMEMGMGMDAGSGGMEAMDAGSYGDMMGGDMMMAGGMSPSVPGGEHRFRRGLQRAIVSIGKAESDQERETLRRYIRQALEKRYLNMIAARHKELDQLKKSVAALADDLNRRELAKDRVIEVQMQSVQLAAEGLLQLGDLGGNASALGDSGEGGGFGMETRR